MPYALQAVGEGIKNTPPPEWIRGGIQMYSTVPPWLRRRAVTHWRGNGRTRPGISTGRLGKWYPPESAHRTLSPGGSLSGRRRPGRVFVKAFIFMMTIAYFYPDVKPLPGKKFGWRDRGRREAFWPACGGKRLFFEHPGVT